MEGFDTLLLEKFESVVLFRASDEPGNGWNTYGPGIIRIHFVKSSNADGQNFAGWGQMTFHNVLTRMEGLNVLIVPNFTMHQSVEEPHRLTFKALSGNYANNGKKNMYSIKLSSDKDAARLWYCVFILQLAAKQALRGNRVTIPSQVSVEATAIRSFMAIEAENVDEVARHILRSRLALLANANAAAFASMTHQFSESFFAAPFPEDEDSGRVTENGNSNNYDGSFVEENESFVQELDHSIDEWDVPGDEYNLESSIQSTPRLDDESDDDDKTVSIGSNDFVESQDWVAAFCREV